MQALFGNMQEHSKRTQSRLGWVFPMYLFMWIETGKPHTPTNLIFNYLIKLSWTGDVRVPSKQCLLSMGSQNCIKQIHDRLMVWLDHVLFIGIYCLPCVFSHIIHGRLLVSDNLTSWSAVCVMVVISYTKTTTSVVNSGRLWKNKLNLFFLKNSTIANLFLTYFNKLVHSSANMLYANVTHWKSLFYTCYIISR